MALTSTIRALALQPSHVYRCTHQQVRYSIFINSLCPTTSYYSYCWCIYHLRHSTLMTGNDQDLSQVTYIGNWVRCSDGMPGEYEGTVPSSYSADNDFFTGLEDHIGLVLGRGMTIMYDPAIGHEPRGSIRVNPTLSFPLPSNFPSPPSALPRPSHSLPPSTSSPPPPPPSTSTPSPSSSPFPSSPLPTPTQRKSSNLGPIVGGIVGGILILILLVLLLFYCHRRRLSKNTVNPCKSPHVH
jgi:hypothetical protein